MPKSQTKTKPKAEEEDDRSPEAASALRGSIEGKATKLDLDHFDPQDKKTKLDEVLGKELVIYEVATRAADEKYADSEGAYRNASGEPTFAILRFYQADDPKKTARFLTTGGIRIVPVIERLIAENAALPVRATIVKDGRVYRFQS